MNAQDGVLVMPFKVSDIAQHARSVLKYSVARTISKALQVIEYITRRWS